ncbi:radical SAM family heme chaperone HemW [bacterium]|nr:radical SAM family heme chaperone HemW [bacterium]
MAGIYIHIPFCKQACFYCDFHFSVDQRNKTELVAAICKEIELNADFFGKSTEIGSIYFGGGTPSLLSKKELDQILNQCFKYFNISKNAEVTLEANPDDLGLAYLKELAESGVNRLSIGVQSLDDEILGWMNRVHRSEEAKSSVINAAGVGFKYINIDMIYAVPGLSLEQWESELTEVMSWPIDHLSAYSLTLEEQTPYAKLVRQDRYKEPDENLSQLHFEALQKKMVGDWEQYEISNFAKGESYSRHNTSYWQDQLYLGIGPGAHSFTGSERYWNVSNNKKYIESFAQSIVPRESEVLSLSDKINERIMTSLRTKWGLDLGKVEDDFGINLKHHNKTEWEQRIRNEEIRIQDDVVYLTQKGMLFADGIAADLFI